jgi:hypothetical protein
MAGALLSVGVAGGGEYLKLRREEYGAHRACGKGACGARSGEERLEEAWGFGKSL